MDSRQATAIENDLTQHYVANALINVKTKLINFWVILHTLYNYGYLHDHLRA